MLSLIVMCALYGFSFLYCFGLVQSVFSFKIYVVRFWYSFFSFCFGLLSSEWLEFLKYIFAVSYHKFRLLFFNYLTNFSRIYEKLFQYFIFQEPSVFAFSFYICFLRFTQLLSRKNWIQLRSFELLWLWYVYCPKFGWRLKQISIRLLLFLL